MVQKQLQAKFFGTHADKVLDHKYRNAVKFSSPMNISIFTDRPLCPRRHYYR